MFIALVGGERSPAIATRKETTCPECGEGVYSVLTRKDTHPYWAHLPQATGQPPRSCRGAGMTAWHYAWQATRTDPACIEVYREGFRADVLTPSGAAVEFQHSPIPSAEVALREQHWKRGVWVVDGTAQQDGVHIRPSGEQHMFNWDRMPRLVSVARWPVWVDLGDRGVIEVDRVSSPTSGVGWLLPSVAFVTLVVNGDRVSVRKINHVKAAGPVVVDDKPTEHAVWASSQECCKGGATLLKCQLCPQSPTYHRKQK